MFCDRCGAALQAGQNFCSICGKAVGAAGTVGAVGMAAVVAPPAEGRVARHMQLLAILWLVLSALRLFGGVAMLLLGGFVAGMVGHVGLGWPFERLVPAVFSTIAGFLLVTAAAGLAAGWGLLERQPWARVLALILGFIALLHFPIGTALGIYTLWVLLPAESEREYRQMARPA